MPVLRLMKKGVNKRYETRTWYRTYIGIATEHVGSIRDVYSGGTRVQSLPLIITTLFSEYYGDFP
jgi:hypothetical protein